MVSKAFCRVPKAERMQAILLSGAAVLAAVCLLAVLFPLQAVSATPPDGQSSSASETYVFVGAWDNAPLPGTFSEPHGIAVDSSGNVYVVDTGNYRIQIFTPDGVFITAWGKWGRGAGKLSDSTGVAVDSNGNVYVAGEWDALQKFSSTGEFLQKWWGWNTMATGVAVDGSNNVYIVGNYDRGLVSKYDASGNFITSWQCTSASHGDSSGIAVDPHGYLYVADSMSSLIYRFDLDGHLLSSWSHDFSEFGGDDSQLAVDGTGNVYALGQTTVAKYSANGAFLGRWGEFHWPHGVAMGPDGSVYVVDTGNNRIQKFAAGGTFVRQWGTASDSLPLRSPEGVTVSGDGTVFVADAEAEQVVAFTSSGVFLTRWDTMDYPSGMSTDGSGNVYVSGPGVPVSGSRTVSGSPYGILEYAPNGVLLNRWGRCCGSSDAATNWASGIAVSPNGNMYVADTNNQRILKLGPDGSLITKWGSPGFGYGQFIMPAGLALAPDGSVYVADTFSNCIQRFTADGGFLARWGGSGTGDGEFRSPRGIVVDSSGYVYVADAFNQRIQKFKPSGAFVTQWGSRGSGNGQFASPLGIAIDSEGFVYVADTYNNRIQKFERASPNLSSSVKLVDKNVAQPGDVLHYTILLHNTGNLDALAVLVTDTIPSSTHFNAGSLWASSGNGSESAGLITWTGMVNVGAPVTITLAVTIDGGVPKGTLITDTATINDGTNPAFGHTAMTIADPYQVYLPMVIKLD